MNKTDKPVIPNEEQIHSLLNKLSRYESTVNPKVYFKAVRVTLLTLGYDEEWVNGDFREKLEETYSYCWDVYNQETSER